jgi:hypothetical protein
MHRSLVPGISDIPMNKTLMDASLSGLFLMALMVSMRSSKWTVPIMSGFRDFRCPSSLDPENSDFSTFLTLARSLTPVPCGQTARILSKFLIWTSSISCPRECRFPDAPKHRCHLISATCHLPMDGPDIRRDFMAIDVSILMTSRILISAPPELPALSSSLGRISKVPMALTFASSPRTP